MKYLLRHHAQPIRKCTSFCQRIKLWPNYLCNGMSFTSLIYPAISSCEVSKLNLISYLWQSLLEYNEMTCFLWSVGNIAINMSVFGNKASRVECYNDGNGAWNRVGRWLPVWHCSSYFSYLTLVLQVSFDLLVYFIFNEKRRR